MKDLTNQRFNRLKAIRPTDQRVGGSVVWECICDCKKIAYKSAKILLKGDAQSCGCLHTEVIKEQANRLLNSPEAKAKSIANTKIAKGCVDGTAATALTSKLRSDNKTGVRGVYYCNTRHKYKSEITFKGKRYSLGYHETLEDAVKIRKHAEELLFEPFLEWYEKEFKKPSLLTKLTRFEELSKSQSDSVKNRNLEGNEPG